MVVPPIIANNEATENISQPIIDEYTSLLESQRSPGSLNDVSASPGGDIKDDEGLASATCDDKEPHENRLSPREIVGILSVLLLGVFIASADGSLVMASYGKIGSEFNSLGSSAWLISSYTVAMCASQSLYGKLSDIYGRKSTILVSYIFFTIGSAICGLGQSLAQVIFGRLVAGIGGAGITCMVSIVIADMVPIREVASWRSYANIVATTGRSLGAPLGGYLTDTIGWRWSFLAQCPATILTLVMVAWKLNIPSKESHVKQSQISKLRRIDFLGAILFPFSLVCGLLVLEFTGQRVAWTDPMILILLMASLVSGCCFLMVEAFWAKEPIFPLRLLRNRDVVTSYINVGFQSGAQIATMMLIPIYFQVSAHASTTEAGAHLSPSVIGNAIGGLLSGLYIRRTGRYKFMSIVGAVASTSCYLLIILRWRGHTSFLESLYIFGGGFGNGVAQSTSFVALNAGVQPGQMAIASSGLFLSGSVGSVTGLSIAATIFQSTLRKSLSVGLEGVDGKEYILNRALEDIEYVQSLKGHIAKIVTQSYIECLEYTHGVSLLGGILTLLTTLSIKEHRL